MPINNFSWVLPKKLAGCDLPGGGIDAARTLWNDIEYLAAEGVRMLISLERPAGPVQSVCEALGIVWHHFPIPDFGTPEGGRAFEKMVAGSIRAFESGTPVCVHCRAGVGRTGMVLACIAGKHLHLGAAEAIAYIKRSRSAIETAGQHAFIHAFLDGTDD